MKLMAIELEGYRRFESRARINLGDRVVALVGPNEAGKSSILRAMLSLNDRAQFSNRDHTRDSPTATVVEAWYVLEDADRKELSDISGGIAVKWWALSKRANGSFAWQLFPAPERDLSSRHSLVSTLQEFESSGDVDRLAKSVGRDTAKQYQRALKALSSNSRSLSDDDVAAIRQLGELREDVAILEPESEDSLEQVEGISQRFHEFLSKFVDYDEGPHPDDEAARRLIERRPEFLLFTQEDRDLKTIYDLAEVMSDIPPALANLARLADLNLANLINASNRNDRGMRETLIDNANDELSKVFKESWNQSPVRVRLNIYDNELEVMVSLPSGGYNELDERSDGLKSFVALRAFIERFDLPVRPILLIDEAETHLHYDAQADLVNVFTRQQFADKVIYTTHSAGCLPPDLGNGVRVVVPIDQKERSTVKNSVWTGGQGGFSSLVLGMGATTFAFLPARHVLLAEGATDAMLYPTLFRDAVGVDSISFQVAPGLAVASRSEYQHLNSEGGTVLFIADGDTDGIKYCRELEAEGVPPTRIFNLYDSFGEPLEIEDLVDSEMFAKAANYELRTFQSPGHEYLPGNLTIGRYAELTAWCKSHGLKCPEKTKIAQRLLNMRIEAKSQADELVLLAESRRVGMAQLLRAIEAGFNPAQKRKHRRSA